MSAQEYVQRVGIFVSSPSDMSVERQIVKRVIEELNSRPTINNQYLFKALLYEEAVPPTAGDFAQMIVDRYMSVENAYIVIGMMWSRMGTPFKHPQTRESFESGTEYEIKMAYRSGADSTLHEPHLLLYRKVVPNPGADSVQQTGVDDFFRKIEQQQGEIKGLYQKFSEAAAFRQMLLKHIEQILVEHPPRQSLSDYEKPFIQVESRIQAGNIGNSTIYSGIVNSQISHNGAKRERRNKPHS